MVRARLLSRGSLLRQRRSNGPSPRRGHHCKEEQKAQQGDEPQPKIKLERSPAAEQTIDPHLLADGLNPPRAGLSCSRRPRGAPPSLSHRLIAVAFISSSVGC